MKDYTIWLRSGESISGKVGDAEEDKVAGIIKMRGNVTIHDTDGYAIIKAKEIVAVGINKHTADIKVRGF